jgi:hypothetical protein
VSDKATVIAKASESKTKLSGSHPRKPQSSLSVTPLVARVSFLQRTVGNHAVGKLLEAGGIQAKLAVSQPGDVHELEADRVAAAVIRMPDSRDREALTLSNHGGEHPGIQRTCSHCEEEERLHREPRDGDSAFLQAKEGASGMSAMTPSVQSRIDSATGAGRPLSESTQAFFEPRFGQDFSDVQIHTDGNAVAATTAVNARAYTRGRHIVFNAGEYQPDTDAGRHLLAHELTHVVQQQGSTTLQRQPKAPDPNAEREAAAREGEAIAACSSDQLEVQLEAEGRLKLDARKRKDTGYALSLGAKDKARVQKAATLSPTLQQEIGVKIRFFKGASKSAYLRIITSAVSDAAEPEQITDILTECATAAKPSSPHDRRDIPCDLSQSEYLLEGDGGPGGVRCMNIKTDAEYKKLFDANIKSAVGYTVPGTTWDNVDYDSFSLMLVQYHNGASEYFPLDSVGNFHYSRGGQASIIRDHKYVKRATGLIYPVFEDRLYFNEHLTPRILSLKNGLRYQVKQLKDMYTLLQAGGSFAAILGLYGLGVESFKASIYAFRRGGAVKLPGRPLPGIGVKPAAARQAFVSTIFGELGGPKRGFRVQIVDDTTVEHKPDGRFTNLGMSARYAGGAETNLATKQIFVHQDLVDANGIVRKWGAPLDLKQVIAHELGHGINGGGPCALASRTGADLPGLSAAQRTGLLNDAVHISRSANVPGERLPLDALHLPKDFEPPKP